MYLIVIIVPSTVLENDIIIPPAGSEGKQDMFR